MERARKLRHRTEAHKRRKQNKNDEYQEDYRGDDMSKDQFNEFMSMMKRIAKAEHEQAEALKYIASAIKREAGGNTDGESETTEQG